MEVQPDFKDLFVLFNDHKVSFIIVGGYALAVHGAPRFTGDIDLFIKPDPDNARKVLSALNDFGFQSLGLEQEDFEKPDQVIQLGVSPVRIDLITSLSGVSWEQVFQGKLSSTYGDANVFYIGREELILNKRASGRKQDLADLEALGEE